MTQHYIGVDVGSGSARAGVFDVRGAMLGSAETDIRTWREQGSVVEQSSEDIWNAVCTSVRAALAEADVATASVAGVGFDATCSLVLLAEGGAPTAAGPSRDPQRNVIVWMDHRAHDQARRINATGQDVLRYVGGTISPEMETPKLLWLAENMPDTFSAAWRFFDLADYLTWRASGSEARSTCTVTCKWTYLAHERRWDEAYFRAIGLGALADEGFERIGTEMVAPGTPLGAGLTARAADDLGLAAGTAVAAGLIDAHAGGIGTVGARGGPGNMLTRMGYVLGTSACTMTTTAQPAFVDGVWGPYFAAMVPGLWLNEGGQSAAGAAIDHLITMHPASAEAARRAAAEGLGLSAWLAEQAAERRDSASVAEQVGRLHVVPEFLGNRAPFADPDARAIIAGVGMDTSVDSLVGLYLAGLCGLGYGARQIIRAQEAAGISTDTIVISGGAGRSSLVRQVLADSTGLAVAASTSPEPVLLGSAILAAVSAGAYADTTTAMQAMSELGDVHLPDPTVTGWHDQRFADFEALQRVGRQIRS